MSEMDFSHFAFFLVQNHFLSTPSSFLLLTEEVFFLLLLRSTTSICTLYSNISTSSSPLLHFTHFSQDVIIHSTVARLVCRLPQSLECKLHEDFHALFMLYPRQIA